MEAVPTAGDDPAHSGRARIRRASTYVVAAFWALQFIESSVVSYLETGVGSAPEFLARLAVLTVGVGVSFALVEITIRLLRRRFSQRVVGAAVSSTIGWLLVSYVNFRVFQFVTPSDHNAGQFVFVALLWSWFLYSLAGAILAVAYYVDVSERDLHFAELAIVARDAQLRALRYQLNPHFLFNSLNSIASLVSGGSADAAERMVENLADFLRSSLALDAGQEITLVQELELQKLYLDVEMVRFPERLRVEIDLPAYLRTALVPSLITQVLVENAIRHSVARSKKMVVIRVAANEAAGMLEVRITNTGGDPGISATPGTGVGLRNVSDRLRTHFGGRGSVEAGPLADGGFTATVSMPLRFQSVRTAERPKFQ